MNKNVEWQEEFAVEPNAEQSRFDFAGFLWRRKSLFVLGIATAIGLGYLYYFRQKPIYESSARVLVVKRAPRTPLSDSSRLDQLDEFGSGLATQIILIRSPIVVQRGVQDHNLRSLASLAGSADPVNAIIRGLEIQPVIAGQSSDVLNLTIRWSHDKDSEAILSAVIKSYQKFLGETQQNVSEETVELITEAKDVLLTQLRDKEREYQVFRQEAPLLWAGNEATNIHQSRLASIEQTRSGLLLARSQMLADVEAIETALQRGGSREALLLMITNSTSNEGKEPGEKASSLNVYADKLFPLLLEEQMLLENHGADHPKVNAIRKRIEFTRLHLQHLSGSPQPDRPADFLAVYLQSLRQQIATMDEKERSLNSLFAQEREAAKSLSQFEIRDETYRSDIARTQQLFEGVVKRLGEINLVKDHGGFTAQVVSAAGPGVQVEPQLPKILLSAGLLGLLSGVALGYLVELADKRFRSAEDIRERLGLPVVGHVPMLTSRDLRAASAGSAIDPAIVAYHRSKSASAEAVRAIRTSLYFSTRGGVHKVIQITSPNPGDGKTTLAANLAVSIAQSGKKVLLLDADCRRPRIHKVFSLERGAGLAAIIDNEAELADVVQETEMTNLWVLTAGQHTQNPSELLSSPRFQELLAVVREQYDFVIVDSPPLLAVTDPSAVAARADGVLLTIRVSKRDASHAIQATGILSSLGANVLGIVVNGLTRKSGYGYGRYGTRSRYGYGYNNGTYGYGYGEYGKYYVDDGSDDGQRAGVLQDRNGRELV